MRAVVLPPCHSIHARADEDVSAGAHQDLHTQAPPLPTKEEVAAQTEVIRLIYPVAT